MAASIQNLATINPETFEALAILRGLQQNAYTILRGLQQKIPDQALLYTILFV